MVAVVASRHFLNPSPLQPPDKPTFKLPANQNPLSPQHPNQNPLSPNTPSFLSLLQRCSSMRELHQIHAQMLKTGAVHDPLSLTRLVSSLCALSDSGDLHYAVRVVVSSLPYPNTLLQGYSRSSTPELCMLLYKQMFEQDPSVLDFHTFPPVLRACGKVGAIVEGTQIHGCAVKSDAVADTYVQNSLIQMYFRCGKSHDGRLLFDKMSNKNVVSWNCVFSGYAELGCWEIVKSLFWLMVGEFLSIPNSITLVRMLTACTRSGDFESGKRVHRYIVENGVAVCLNLGNALINMYAKFGEMEEARVLFRKMPEQDVVSWTTLVSGYACLGHLEVARDLFDKMPARNVVAWNAMISGYVLNCHFKEAVLLFKEMMVLHVKLDNATTISVLSACARSGDLVLGRVVHGYIYKVSVDTTLELIHSLLGMYAKCGSMGSAECLFDRMSVRNEISWTLMMEGYVKYGAKEIALEIFNQMPYKDVASWNALITVLARCNFFKDALDMFEEMQRLKVKPNGLTLVSTLSACARVGALALGKWIHAYIDRSDVEMDCHLGCALIDMYAKCGCVELSLEIFDNMPDKDLLAWSTMIGGLAMHGRAQLALKLFERMLDDGVRPDGITFLGVLGACCHAGLVDEGRRYFDLMTRVYGISPMTEHYSCMVDLFGRRGLLSEANHFVKNIDAHPNSEAIWGALLSACLNYESVEELAEYATSRLLDVDPSNSGAYVLLSNVYAKASKWDDVGKVRNLMREKGLQKIPGCSSIEVNGLVHEFFVGDASHPQSREIYVMLDGLEKQLETTT